MQRFLSKNNLFTGVIIVVACVVSTCLCFAETMVDNKGEELPELTLQGIVWSKNALLRFTLINDQIVKEGMVIDGCTVLRIQPESVIVSYRGVSHVKRMPDRNLNQLETEAETEMETSELPPDGVSDQKNDGPDDASELPASKGVSQVKTTGGLSNIRYGPKMNAPVKMRIPAGVSLTVVDRRGDWFKLDLSDGTTGWIHTSVVKTSEE